MIFSAAGEKLVASAVQIIELLCLGVSLAGGIGAVIGGAQLVLDDGGERRIRRRDHHAHRLHAVDVHRFLGVGNARTRHERCAQSECNQQITHSGSMRLRVVRGEDGQ